MQSVAIGWYLYDLTGDPMVLAYIGLALFVPIALFTLTGGDVADRVDRRRILGVAHLVQALCATALVFLIIRKIDPWAFYAVLAVSGTARAFSAPAVSSFIPFLVPREQFPQAIAWGSSANQIATVLGPAVGGYVYLAGPEVTFSTCVVMSLMVAASMFSIRSRGGTGIAPTGGAVSRLRAGLAYLRRHRIVLGAISLDLFAVLLGSVTALLPIFARDILVVGPDGLGLMRSSIAIGAVTTGLALAHLPPARHPHAGGALFAGVAVFGVAAMVFGLSTTFAVSLVALAVMGAADMVSVFVRNSVIQLATPDAMRGRVSAVHSLFVGTANELGDFRGGAVAAALGAVPAVLAGGAATLGVVALWAWRFPELRSVARLADVKGS
jgi:predicted MFS family arabinose efflux permease